MYAMSNGEVFLQCRSNRWPEPTACLKARSPGRDSNRNDGNRPHPAPPWQAPRHAQRPPFAPLPLFHLGGHPKPAVEGHFKTGQR